MCASCRFMVLTRILPCIVGSRLESSGTRCTKQKRNEERLRLSSNTDNFSIAFQYNFSSRGNAFETAINCRIKLSEMCCKHSVYIYKYVFAYRKHHGCDTAILSLTELWKQNLDDDNIIGIVSMDLSKAFDTLPHDLMVLKLKQQDY